MLVGIVTTKSINTDRRLKRREKMAVLTPHCIFILQVLGDYVAEAFWLIVKLIYFGFSMFVTHLVTPMF